MYIFGGIIVKRIIAKIFLYISLVPYAWLISVSTYYAIVGVSYKGSVPAYGIDGFLLTAMFFGFVFIIAIPILPLCLLYQIIYFIALKRKLQIGRRPIIFNNKRYQ